MTLNSLINIDDISQQMYKIFNNFHVDYSLAITILKYCEADLKNQYFEYILNHSGETQREVKDEQENNSVDSDKTTEQHPDE